MVSKKVTVKDQPGIHLVPASLLVNRANEFDAQISIRKGDNMVNAKSVLGIIALGASYESTLEIIAEGEDEQAAVEALATLFEKPINPPKGKKESSP